MQLTVRVSPIEFKLSEVEYMFLFGMMNSVTQQIDAVTPKTAPPTTPTAIASPSALVVPEIPEAGPPVQQGLVYVV